MVRAKEMEFEEKVHLPHFSYVKCHILFKFFFDNDVKLVVKGPLSTELPCLPYKIVMFVS